MPGNPYRIVMAVFAIFGLAAGAIFFAIGFVGQNPVQTTTAWGIAAPAAGFGAFWFTVWLIVSAARWQPPRD